MSHIHEKIDFTAQAFIVHEGKVLLRMHDKYNVWLGIGGHIELDEDPVQALEREVKEESGLGIELISGSVRDIGEGRKDIPAPQFISRMFINPTHEHVDLIYVAKAITLDLKPAPTEKEVEFRWFSPEDVLDPKFGVQKHVQHYALEAIRLVGESN